MRARTLAITALVLTGLVGVVSLGGHLALRQIDLGAHKDALLAALQAATGRPASCDELQLAFDGGFVVRARNLVLANAAWGAQRPMLQVARAEARIAPWPLLWGRLRVDELHLAGLELFLESAAGGRDNWSFAPGLPSDGAQGPGLPALTVENGSLVLHLASLPPLAARDLTFSWTAVAGGSRLRGSALFGDRRLQLRGVVQRSVDEPRARSVAFELDGIAERFEVTGRLEHASWGWSPRLALHVRAVHADVLAALLGQDTRPVPGLDLELRLARTPDAWQVDGLHIRAGRNDLGGALRVAVAGSRALITGDLRGARLDLDELLPRRQASARPTTRLFAAAALDLGWLEGFDAVLAVHLGQLEGRGAQLRDARIEARLAGGRLDLDLTEAQVAEDGRASAAVALDTTRAPPAARLDLALRRVPAALLLGPAGGGAIDAPADLRLELRSRGRSPAELAGGLDGEARLLIGRGRARLRKIDAMVGGLSTLTGQLLDGAGEDARLNCAMAHLSIERGVATTKALLVDSAAATLRGDGRVDLGRERIDLTFTPRPKTTTLTVAVPVRVRGPLRAPEFRADRAAAAQRVAGLVGLFVYPPVALAALGELGDDTNPCLDIARGDGPQARPAGGVEKIRRSLTTTTRKLGRRLRDLFGG